MRIGRLLASKLLERCRRLRGEAQPPAPCAADRAEGEPTLPGMRPGAVRDRLVCILACAECGATSAPLLSMLWLSGEFRCPYCRALALVVPPPLEEWNVESIAWGRVPGH